MEKAAITPRLVSGLVAMQFPQWAHLPVAPVDLDGHDNTTFRLGDELSVRLPSAEDYVPQVEKEHRWLPVLAPHLPLPIPEAARDADGVRGGVGGRRRRAGGRSAGRPGATLATVHPSAILRARDDDRERDMGRHDEPEHRLNTRQVPRRGGLSDLVRVLHYALRRRLRAA
jgi:hypothetical protein